MAFDSLKKIEEMALTINKHTSFETIKSFMYQLQFVGELIDILEKEGKIDPKILLRHYKSLSNNTIASLVDDKFSLKED